MTIQSGFRFAACCLLTTIFSHAAVVIDARKVPASPQKLPFNDGGRSPQGHALAADL
jgi:hypothetical protein